MEVLTEDNQKTEIIMVRTCGVLHLTDTLNSGGKERVVVNLVNHLPRQWYKPFVCITRRDGPLSKELASDVITLHLGRKYLLDVKALTKLIFFIRYNRIEILHAHGPAVFMATVASLFPPFPKVVWHIHDGGMANVVPPSLAYRLMARRVSGVITVTQALADWVSHTLPSSSDRVSYIPNYMEISDGACSKISLPGVEGFRIVCLANLFPVKDHPTLLRAMLQLIQKAPKAHLFLVGTSDDVAYLKNIESEIETSRLIHHVTLLGYRNDIMSILSACDIGVLSSKSEGFPMVLLEYGIAGLPTVATQVGQCPEILDYGRAGILVPPDSPVLLAQALEELLLSPKRRKFLGKQLNRQVREKFNRIGILEKVCLTYRMICGQGIS